MLTLQKEDISYTEASGIAAAKTQQQHEYMISALRQGKFDDLNIFFVQRIWEKRPGDISFGLATPPNANQPEMDGITVVSEVVTGQNTDAVTKFVGENLPESAVTTTAHEFGHWLGLFHTNTGGCDGDRGADGKLYINDTNLEKPVIMNLEGRENICNVWHSACEEDKPVMTSNMMSTRYVEPFIATAVTEPR